MLSLPNKTASAVLNFTRLIVAGDCLWLAAGACSSVLRAVAWGAASASGAFKAVAADCVVSAAASGRAILADNSLLCRSAELLTSACRLRQQCGLHFGHQHFLRFPECIDIGGVAIPHVSKLFHQGVIVVAAAESQRR